MKKKRISGIGINIILIGSLFIGCAQKSQPNISGERVREYANALYNRELYKQAVQEYQRYLDLYSIEENQQANIYFIIGNVYFDRLNEYENAMAHYLKIKHVFPESTLMPQVNKKIVACLERLQRSTDAKQALDEATSLDPGQIDQARPGEVIAKIGTREVTSGDLAHHISRLPDYMQSQIKDQAAKVDFLKQLIATELFYDGASRKVLDKDKDVIEGTFQAKKSLMVQKYLEQEIASQVNITQEDVELYFKANQDRYVDKDEKGNVIKQKGLNEVGKQVAEDLMRERQQKAYQALLERMMRAEKVEIYDDRVK